MLIEYFTYVRVRGYLNVYTSTIYTASYKQPNP